MSMIGQIAFFDVNLGQTWASWLKITEACPVATLGPERGDQRAL